MKKKKKNKNKFKDLDLEIGYKQKKAIENIKIVKNISGNSIITLPNISYIIIKQKNKENMTMCFTIYNKDNFELIQEIKSNNLDLCYPSDDNTIFFSGKNDLSEIWKRDKPNLFTKYKFFNASINSNILYNSKLHLFFHHIYSVKQKIETQIGESEIQVLNSEIQIWDTEDMMPKTMINKFKTNSSDEKILFFLSNESILVVHHCPYDYDLYIRHSDDISISFYDTSNMKNIKNITLDNNYCDLKPIKLDENRIILIEKISEDCSYDDNIQEKIKIMKVPEFEIVMEFEPSFACNDILVYDKYFILYDSMIKIYSSKDYQLYKEINLRGIHSLFHFKDNYFIGLVNQYSNTEQNPIEKINNEKNLLKNLIMYEINFT